MLQESLQIKNELEDKVLMKSWLVACLSENVKESPIQVQLMGERIVVFRNSKGIHAFKDLCCHRGAALSLGEVKNDCLVCHYHGWEYDETGSCVHIPQLPEGRAIPTQARVTKYSCMEKYGFIWINMEGNEPDIFKPTEIGEKGYHHIPWHLGEVTAQPPRVIENFLDVGHLAVVHDGYIGARSHPLIGDYKVHHNDGRIYSDEIPIYQPNVDGSGKAKYVYYTFEILQPFTAQFIKRDPDNDEVMTILLSVRPIDEKKSIGYGRISFNYDTNLSDEEIVKYNDAIFAQDKPVVQNQKPEELPLDLQVEMSLVSDRMSIAYRQYLQKLGIILGTS